MSHYYTNDPNVSRPNVINYTYKGKLLKFNVDSGVFSKNRVDFGTNVLLNSLEEIEGNSILDLGCGYGVIGICLGSYYPKKNIILIDVNRAALSLAKSNIDLNTLKNCTTLESNLYENLNSKFDLIISNPPIRAGKKVVFEIITNGFNFLNESGEIIVVIQKKQGAPSLQKHMLDVFKNCEVISKEKGYYVLKSKKSTSCCN